MKYFVLIILFCFSPLTFAQTCENAPDDAVLKIQGAPVDEWATISCSKYGHLITYTPDHGFMVITERKPIVFPAQVVKGEPKEGPNEFYFTNISTKQLTDSANEFVHRLHQKNIFASFGQDIPSEKPKIWEIEATTNEGKLLAVFFYEYSDITYGTSCWESCTPTRGFVVLKKPNTP